MFHGFRYVFHMINKGQIHTGIISKETQLNIILSSPLPLTLSFLMSLSLKKLVDQNVNLAFGLHPASMKLKCE